MGWAKASFWVRDVLAVVIPGIQGVAILCRQPHQSVDLPQAAESALFIYSGIVIAP